MDVSEAINKRRSVRDYSETAVPKDKLEKVLEAARLAPSAHNAQDWKFIVVSDPKTRLALVEAAGGQVFIAKAPIIIAAVALDPDYQMSCGVPSYAVNLAIAVEHMTLQAVEEGLGTCWIGAFDQEQVKAILGVPKQYKVVALLPLGYPADSEKEKVRKKIDEIVCYEKFK